MCHVPFPGGSAGKESACNAGDLSSIPGLGRFPGEGHGNPCSVLEQDTAGSNFSSAPLSGCGVWVTSLSFLNGSVLICILGRIEVPPQ